MSDYQGNIIIKNPATPTGPSAYGSAPGMWKLNEVAYWIKQGVWPNPAVTPDLYFPYVSLLLSTTSLGNANNNLFVDSSGAFNPISRSGNTTQGSFTPYGASWSNYFDGTGDYLSVASNAAFGMGTGDFTIELWVNPTAFTGSGNVLVDMRSGTEPSVRPDLEYNSSGVLNYRVNGSTVISGGTLAIGTWSHVAIARSGTTTKLFLNGVQVGSSYSDSNNYGASAACRIGADDDGGPNAYVNGYISNVRVVKGTAVYTAAFTPPTSNLTAISGTSLLTCQSNRFRDASTNNFTITVTGNTSVTEFSPFAPAYPGISYNQSDITNWSGYFDGTGDNLTIPSNAAFGFGTGDFTIEFWAYIPTWTGDAQLIGCHTAFVGYDWLIQQFSSGQFRWLDASLTLQSGTVPVTNQWNHYAVTRSGTTLRIFLNGTQTASGTSTANIPATRALGIMGDTGASATQIGYMSNVRIVKGTAVYTSAFTPPTTNLTAISGTSLLTLQNAAFTDNSTNSFIITINGNTTVTGNSPFNTVGYWSNYFNGGTNYLTTSSTTWTQLGTGNFTVEGWGYINAYGTYFPLCDTRASPTFSPWILGVNSSGFADFYYGTTAGGRITDTVAVGLNTWVHLAAVRSGSTITLYVNGVSKGTATYSSAMNGGAATIGRIVDGFYANGYISNFRVVVGTAVYTSNFTPPTTPLTAISGTQVLTCQNGRIIDNSTNNSTITVTGTVSTQSFDPFYTSTIASNGGSMYFDGTGDYLTVPSSPGLNFGTSNWTIECWVYVSTRTTNYPLVFGNNRGSFTTDALALTASNSDNVAYNNKFVIAWGSAGWSSPSAGNSQLLVANVANVTGTWYHLAIVRESSTSVKMYRDGVQVANATVSSGATFNWGFSGSLLGGGNWDGAQGAFNGYISNLRATPSAVYTAAFTPPTTPLTPSANTTLLVNGMNAGAYDATAINNMETVGNAQVTTAVSKFGGSSVYFDGTGDNLICNPSTPDVFAFGSGNFTIEFWAYMNSVSGIQVFYDGRPASVQGLYPTIYISGTQVRYFTSSADRITGGTVATGTWYHIAVSRSGTSTRMFLNGTQIGSTYTDTSAYTNTTNRPGIGFDANASTYYLNGYIDDLRVTKGVARYTANFTPPTQAFPPY
jgi:hypothetical protein